MIWNEKQSWPREGNNVFIARAFLAVGERMFGDTWTAGEDDDQRMQVQEEIADACYRGAIRTYAYVDHDTSPDGLTRVASKAWFAGNIDDWFRAGRMEDDETFIFLDGGDYTTWIEERFPREPQDLQPSQPKRQNQGGRPTAADWDDMWIEVVLFVNREPDGVGPDDRARLKAVMMKWLETNAPGASDKNIDNRLKKLIARLQR